MANIYSQKSPYEVAGKLTTNNKHKYLLTSAGLQAASGVLRVHHNMEWGTDTGEL